MSRFTLSRTAGALVAALGLIAAGGRAADPAVAADKTAESKRAVYLVKHRPAKDLAAVLSSSFQGAAEIELVRFGDRAVNAGREILLGPRGVLIPHPACL